MEKKTKKTTIAVKYKYSPYFSMYTGFHDFSTFYIDFYGSRANDMKSKWLALLGTKTRKAREEFQAEKALKVKKLEDAILITPKSWFCNKRKELEKQLAEERAKEFLGFGISGEWMIALEFVSSLNGVLVSTGDDTKIYEV